MIAAFSIIMLAGICVAIAYVMCADIREVRRLKRLIHEHRAKTRVDPCWENDEDLWRDALGDGDSDWPHGRYTTKAEMLRECEIYVAGHCGEKI